MLNKNTFQSPPMQYRPLQIVHDMGLYAELGIDECRRRIRERFGRLKKLGFGGVVANVSHRDYLEREENWEIFGVLLDEAQGEGFLVWLYDEKGYPSGSAGGLTLREHPEYESTGLVALFEEIKGGNVEIRLPRGHSQVVSVRAYRSVFDVENSIDLSEYVDDAGTLKWDAPEGEWLVAYFATKPLFEGTHAQHNFSAARRYLNLLDRDGVARFIEVTYKPYVERFPQHAGKTLCAAFTDEPSFIPTYMPELSVKVAVEDEPDENIPKYPTHTWVNGRRQANECEEPIFARGLFEEFLERRGYDLEPLLIYLFRGEGEKAKQVRCDFHQTLSEIYSENFAGQIAEFCQKNGIAFSGHLLWEESLVCHAILEGNYFAQLSKMDFPGIDILTTNPSTIAGGRACLTAKFISSVAHLHGKRHTMSETSGFSERMGGREITKEMMIGTANVLYVLGIDIITSYYGDNALNPEEYRQYCDYVARLGAMLNGGKHIAPVAIYYPIESLWAEYLPSANIIHDIPHSETSRHIDATFAEGCRALLSNQLDFDIIDIEGVTSAKAEEGKLATKYEEFPVLVLPPMEIIDIPLLQKLEELADNNVSLIVFQPHAKIGRKADQKQQVQSTFDRLLKNDNVTPVANAAEMIEAIQKNVEADFKLTEPNPHIFYSHHRHPQGDVYFIVNTAPEATTFSVALSKRGQAELWDAESGEVIPLSAEIEGERTGIRLSLEGYAGVFVRISEF